MAGNLIYQVAEEMNAISGDRDGSGVTQLRGSFSVTGSLQLMHDFAVISLTADRHDARFLNLDYEARDC